MHEAMHRQALPEISAGILIRRMAARRIVLTPHAWEQLRHRGIPEDLAALVASQPEQTIPVRTGREIRQSVVRVGGKWYLVRVVVDLVARDIEIVTVYRTSNVGRYWRRS